METFFKIIEIIVQVLNTYPQPNKLAYCHIADLCIPWNSTKDCYIFELSSDGNLNSLYTPFGKQLLHISDSTITNKILSHFSYIPIHTHAFLITHIHLQPISYLSGTSYTMLNYFIPNSKMPYITTKQTIDDEIKRLVSSHHLTDDFGALDQLVATPDEYANIVDIIGNQNTVCKSDIESYMRPSPFLFLHLFGLIIMTESNIYLCN